MEIFLGKPNQAVVEWCKNHVQPTLTPTRGGKWTLTKGDKVEILSDYSESTGGGQNSRSWSCDTGSFEYHWGDDIQPVWLGIGIGLASEVSISDIENIESLKSFTTKKGIVGIWSEN